MLYYIKLFNSTGRLMKNATNKMQIVSASFVSFGLLLIVYLIFLVSAPSGQCIFNIMLMSAENVFPGTTVSYAGKKVGSISYIDYAPVSHKGDTYYYKAIAHVNAKVKIFENDSIMSCSSGILGERTININPAPPHDKSMPLKSGSIIYSSDSKTMEDAAKNMGNMANSASEIMSKMNDSLEKNKDNVVTSIAHIKEISSKLHELAQEIVDYNLGTQLQVATKKIDGLLSEIHDSIAILNQKNTWEHAAEIMKNTRNITDTLSYIATTHNLNIGDLANAINSFIKECNNAFKNDNSSLHKLITSPEIYSSTIESVKRINNLLYDINKYGIFYTSSRSWQRERLPFIKQPDNR